MPNTIIEVKLQKTTIDIALGYLQANSSGGLSPEDRAKLDGIQEGATANATNAQLRDRTTHTGTQAISTVTGLQTALDGKQATLVSATNIKTINGSSILGSGDLVVSGGGGTTNLTYTASPTNGIVVSDTGTDATLPLADGTNAGLMTPANFTKLAGIASGATANSSDATLLARANHTGTQSAGTITGLATVATSGAYADLTGKPTIPTLTSQLTNDSGFLTTNAVSSVAGRTGAVTLTTADVGLSNVDNTSDANKPISTATQTALNAKQNTITTGTISQYFRGDLSLATLDKNAVGLSNVANADTTTTANITDSSNKRFITDVQQTVLNNTSGTNTGDNAVNTLYSGLVSNATHTGDVTGSTALTIANSAVTLAKMADMATASLIYRKTAGTGTPEVNTLATLKTDLAITKSDVGLGNVDNTTDLNKPISTATQTALDLKANSASSYFTYAVGRWYSTNTLTSQNSNSTMTANTLVAIPFVVARSITINELQFEVPTAVASSNVIAGIYSSDSSLLPATKLVDTGSISSATTGMKTSGTLGSPVTLTSGLHYAVFAFSHAVGVRSWAVYTGQSSLGLASNFGTSNSTYASLSISRTYDGTLPASCGYSYPTNAVLASTQVPILAYKISALP